MPNEQLIDTIISPEAFAQLETLLKQLGIAKAEFVSLAKEVNTANNAISGRTMPEFTKSVEVANTKMNEFAKAQQQITTVTTQANSVIADSTKILNDSTGSLNQNIKLLASQKLELKNVQEELKKLNSTYAGSAQSQKALADKTADLTKREVELKSGIQQTNLSIKQSVRESQAAEGSYTRLSANLIRLKASYQGLTEAERNNVNIGGVLQASIVDTDTKLKALDATQGMHTRNVGNYTGAIGKAWAGLKTLANILPGVGIAGLLAFALDPILDWVKNLELIKGTAKQIATENAIASDSYKDAVKEVTSLRVAVDEYHNGIITGTQLVKIYNDGIGDTAGKLKTAGEVEEFYNSKAGLYVEAMFLRAKANSALQKAIEDQTKAEERAAKGPSFMDYTAASLAKLPEVIGGTLKDTFNLLVNPFSVKRNGLTGAIDEIYSLAGKAQKQGVRDLQKTAKTSTDLFKELQIASDKFNKKAGLDLSGKKDKAAPKKKADTGAIDTLKTDLEEAANIYKQDAENEAFSLEGRNTQLENYLKIKGEIIKLEADKEKKDKKLSTDQLNAIDAEAQKKQNELRQYGNAQRLKILQDQLNQEQKLLIERNTKNLTVIAKLRDEEIASLQEQFATGAISEKDYLAERERLQTEFTKRFIAEQMKQTEAFIEQQKLRGLDTTKLEAEAAALRVQYNDEGNKKILADKKTVADKEKELARELLTFTSSLISASFTNQLNAIQKQIDANEERKAIDIENVNNSVASEEEKADKIAIINARAAAQQELLEQKQRAIRVRQAKAEKAAAIAGIIMNIALANTKTLGQTGLFGIPLLGIIAAIGAAQIATVLATPIPEYKYGVESSPEGPAWVGDGYKHELMIDPSGSMSITPNKPTLTYLKKGTKIVGGDKFEQMINVPSMPLVDTKEGADLSRLIFSQESGNKRIIKAINGQKSHNTIITKGGWRNTQNKMNGFDKYVKRNF